MSSRGYTLIEILVALGIFILMLGYVGLKLQFVDDADRIKADASKLTAVLREARNSAFNGIVNSAAGKYPEGGYGVFFKNNTDLGPMAYWFFADDNGNHAPDLVELPAGSGKLVSPESLEKVTLSKNINFDPPASQLRSIIFTADSYVIYYCTNYTTCSTMCADCGDTLVRLKPLDSCPTADINVSGNINSLFIDPHVTDCP